MGAWVTCRVQYLNDTDPFAYASSFPEPARPPLHCFSTVLPLAEQLAAVHRLLMAPQRLDDAALQLYKDGDFGPYLDLDASIAEQQEDFEDFHANRKNSLVLRTQLSVRVHTIIEKLVTSEGRELRRALFSLKQIFQEDKDLVHEFVQNEGLSCLVQVGSTADQKYQNYILRALGQVMLYVDGMNGVMEHPATLQWLYSLIASRFRLVVKTALKLLLVFIEYTDANSLLLIRAVHAVDAAEGLTPWSRVIRLLMDYDAADTELLIYAMTLLNKTLAGVPDQDTYYDQVDLLEEQGIENVINRYMSRQGTDLDLLRQLQIYEAVLQFEDGAGGGDRGLPLRQLDDNLRKTLRNRKSLTSDLSMGVDRRRSRRHSTGTVPPSLRLSGASAQPGGPGGVLGGRREDAEDSSSSQSSQALDSMHLNGNYKETGGLTPALAQRLANGTSGVLCPGGPGVGADSNLLRAADRTPLLNAVNRMDSRHDNSWAFLEDSNGHGLEDLPARRENTVKDLTQKLASQNILQSPVDENKSFINDMSGMAGIISKAKEGLAKSKSKQDVSPTTPPPPPPSAPAPKIKSETELHWEELVSNLSRSLELCDLDFTDLHSDDEEDVLCPANAANGVPLPPPPPAPMMLGGDAPPPPPPTNGRLSAPNGAPTILAPPVFGVSLRGKLGTSTTDGGSLVPPPPPPPPPKNKKTVKLFWKEVRDDPAALVRTHYAPMLWDELRPVDVDTQKLEHLFESRAKDLISKKQQELNKNKEIIVLDHKRSNAINIGMTKLPPPRSIKTAILKMDATVMNREGIEKLLTMLPTDDERSRIQEAQAAAPDTPLGSAEQFLLTLASISELPARLKLWAFKLDYENMEKEIAEPLMDLKQGMETLRSNKTFRCILQTLLSIGIFLNGSHVKGFQIEYLAKVPEVKDTVHKHSLLHHLSHMVMDKFPDASDLYSEIGAVTRASKVDFDELAANIVRMETECKASWDRLKLVAKHDGSTMVKVKMSDFLADCAERIIVLSVVHRRVMNRFHRFLLWLGVPLARLPDTKPSEFCRVVSEFALEYRTTRERVLQQLQKKANHRERNKTRGKMITEVGKFQGKEVRAELRADAELRQLLGSDISDVESIHGTMPWGRRQRKDIGRTVLSPLSPLLRDDAGNGDNLTDGDDEILESLVKTATKLPSSRTVPRERKRTRHADRKSLKRSRTRENASIAGNVSESP